MAAGGGPLDLDNLQNSFLFHMMPPPLRNALVQDAGAEVVQSLIQHGAGGDDDLVAQGSIVDLARIASESFLAALLPLATRQMQTMSPAERRCVMSWLSNPEPIAKAMQHLIEHLLGDQETAQQVTEAAYSMASSMAEMGTVLHNVSHEDIVNELNMLREAMAGGNTSAQDHAAQQRVTALARSIAADAQATAHNALLPSKSGGVGVGGGASSSASASASASASTAASTSASASSSPSPSCGHAAYASGAGCRAGAVLCGMVKG